MKNHPTAHVISYYSDGLPSLVLHVGMEFKNPEEAWAFWLSYAGQRGFEVRKRYTNKRPSDGKVTSCRFVCANEGHRLKDKRDRIIKCPRAETRTDCQVHMSLKMDRQNGKMKVNELVSEHNHALHLPETLHLLVSQRKISDLQAFEIETADDVGIGPKAAHELASHQEEERREERRKEKEEERRQEKKRRMKTRMKRRIKSPVFSRILAHAYLSMKTYGNLKISLTS